MEALNPQKPTIIIFILSILFFALPFTNAKSQNVHLTKLYKAKYQGSNGDYEIDKNSYDGKTNNNKHHHDHDHDHHHHHHDQRRFSPLDAQKEMKDGDKILTLPGQPLVNFTQYGGYVTVDNKNGRAFYYYFVEALNNKKSKPLLLWLNGGPGCSSLAYGAMEEIGPFRVKSDGKTLYRNKFGWNHVANVLFLESPAGVGFSYSNTTSDYDTNGDTKTAEDNYVFLLNWFERFPEYKGRDFYIAGESYAGHYVPQLAHAIIQHNVNATKHINLKGIIIGNAAINDESDLKGMYDYFWSHALISDQVKNNIMGQCNFSPNASTQTEECNSAANQAEIDIQYLDIYNIYAPICLSSNLTIRPKKLTHALDPCSDHYVTAYLNTPEVQKALHANVTKLSYDWQPCSSVLNKWSDSPSTVIPLLKELTAKGLRVWIFSGDTDGRIPVTSTRDSLNVMNLQIKAKWHPWFIKGEVGGYTEEYEGNLTFATVRGAGHQVPSFQPVRALALISHFLAGTPLPNTLRTKNY